MKVLVAYAVSDCVFSRFEAVQKLQPFLPWADQICFRSETFHLAKLRNEAIQHAKDFGYEWVFLADVDFVITFPPWRYPESGFGKVFLRNQREDGTLEPGHHTQHFLIHKRFFGRRFCEEFKGYGLEEVDFEEHVMNGVVCMPTDMEVIHLHHPPRFKEIQNMELFMKRRRELRPDKVNEERWKSAFSLIELLVVLAIAGCLFATILSVMTKAKSRAKQIHCMSNLHQTVIWYLELTSRETDENPPPKGLLCPVSKSDYMIYEDVKVWGLADIKPVHFGGRNIATPEGAVFWSKKAP